MGQTFYTRGGQVFYVGGGGDDYDIDGHKEEEEVSKVK